MQEKFYQEEHHQNVSLLCLSILVDGACKLISFYTVSQNSAALLTKTPFAMLYNSRVFGGNGSQ